MRFCSFASKDTLFPIKREVKRATGQPRRGGKLRHQAHQSEDEDAKRLRRSELVLKKFGLLPRDFDLGKFLVMLLKEQVAGYYDPKTKTVNLLDWLGLDQQKPVLAHELTHALQDQSFNLEKYMKPATPIWTRRKKSPRRTSRTMRSAPPGRPWSRARPWWCSSITCWRRWDVDEGFAASGPGA